jgi:quercetin dioxygenase-like cupin family protein
MSKATPKVHVQRLTDLPLEVMNPLLSRRALHTERTTLAQIFLKKGCIVPRHSHENEQLAYVITGKLLFRLGENLEQEVILEPGDVLVIPPNLPHMAEALEDTLDLDIFAPKRQDWLEGDDSYLR